VTRLQAEKLRELRSISSNGKRNVSSPKLQNGTGAHRAFFPIRPADKGVGV